MATMKDLALKIHQRTSRYTNLNQQIQDNSGNINTNLSKISTIEGQVQELQAKANALRGYKEYNANEAYSVGDIIEAEGLFKVIKAITADEEHPELSDPEYFVNLTYTLDDLDALISRLDAELGSLAEIAGQIEFDTVELGGNTYPLVMNISPQIDFTVSKAGTNINFFSPANNFNTSDYDVYINGTKTSQAFNSLTFKANDRIQIKANKKVNFYPYFLDGEQDYFKSINSALPLLSLDNTNGATDFDGCFQNCSSLTSIPQDLFKYNPQAIGFDFCFLGCIGITSNVPELWVTHPNSRHMGCFRGCTNASNYADIPRVWRTN